MHTSVENNGLNVGRRISHKTDFLRDGIQSSPWFDIPRPGEESMTSAIRSRDQSSSCTMILATSEAGITADGPSSSLAAEGDSFGAGPTSSSSLSLSSLFLKTSSFPLTSLRFLIGPSSCCPSAFGVSLDAALAFSFFFCLLARFFAVFASSISSRSCFRCSNSR